MTGTPSQTHRMIALLSVVSLFTGLRANWDTAMEYHVPVGILITSIYGVILAAGVAVLIVKTKRSLFIINAVLLVMALLSITSGWLLHHGGSDEGNLTAYAADQLLRGHHIYGQNWFSFFTSHHIVITKTMNGSGDFSYGYPPLAVLLTLPIYALHHTTAAATLVTTVALMAAVVLMWLWLPNGLRPVAVITGVGFNLLAPSAEAGYPAMLAMVFLLPAVAAWHRTGVEGRLGWSGYLRAVCVGLACAGQQLAWFATPFLIVGIFALRLPELGLRRTLWLTVRYLGVALLTWLAVNSYFIITETRDWLNAIPLLLTQHAILHGQGLVSISYYLTTNSGGLDFYSYASILLLFGLLGMALFGLRRMGPALLLLPWLVFYFSTRSQDGYYTLLLPVWIIAVFTVPRFIFKTAWQPTWLTRDWARRAGAMLLLVPSVVCILIAILSPAPLQVKVTAVDLTSTHQSITEVDMQIKNVSTKALSPHFAYRSGQGASAYWLVKAGPRTLQPGQSARYIIKPSYASGLFGIQKTIPVHYLIIVSDKPMTLTSVYLTKKELATNR